MTTMMAHLSALTRDDSGQDLIEYALLAAFLSLAAAGGAAAVGLSLDGWYTAVSGTIDTMNTAPTP
jgi:Flp pilus assembly pilin Flp